MSKKAKKEEEEKIDFQLLSPKFGIKDEKKFHRYLKEIWVVSIINK